MLETTEILLLREDELELCAGTVAALTLDQGHEITASLAWMIRNRIEALHNDRKRISLAATCEAVLKEALADINAAAMRRHGPQREWRRIRAANDLVWKGEISDSTQGATACHRHDRNPYWARRRKPTALLGEYLFFR